MAAVNLIVGSFMSIVDLIVSFPETLTETLDSLRSGT